MTKSIIKEIKILDLISKLKNSEFVFLLPLVSFIHCNNQLPDNYNYYISQIPIRQYQSKNNQDFLVLQTLLLLKKFDTQNSLLPLFKVMKSNYNNLSYFNLNSSFKNIFLKPLLINKNSKIINKLIFDERFSDKLPEILYSCYHSNISSETKNNIIERFIYLNTQFNKEFLFYLFNFSSKYFDVDRYILYLRKTPNFIEYLSLQEELILEKHKNNNNIIQQIHIEYEKISIKFNFLNF